jgi:LemA protein
VAEAYPQLQADDNFRQLQSELSTIETELQSARRYYNATARDLNTKVVSFPDMVFAGPLGFKEEPYYEDADPAIQSAPKVEFQQP